LNVSVAFLFLRFECSPEKRAPATCLERFQVDLFKDFTQDHPFKPEKSEKTFLRSTCCADLFFFFLRFASFQKNSKAIAEYGSVILPITEHSRLTSMPTYRAINSRTAEEETQRCLKRSRVLMISTCGGKLRLNPKEKKSELLILRANQTLS